MKLPLTLFSFFCCSALVTFHFSERRENTLRGKLTKEQCVPAAGGRGFPKRGHHNLTDCLTDWSFQPVVLCFTLSCLLYITCLIHRRDG